MKHSLFFPPALSPHNRTVNLSVLASSWMTSFLCGVGFLPQAKLLYLPPDHLDLLLLSTALAVIDGVELAVTRGAVHVARYMYTYV
jgi:hypothetical protein